MSKSSRIADSADLMHGMIRRLGKIPPGSDGTPNLAQAQELRALTLACTKCSDPASCAALQNTVQHLAEPPSYCPNAASLMALIDDIGT